MQENSKVEILFPEVYSVLIEMRYGGNYRMDKHEMKMKVSVVDCDYNGRWIPGAIFRAMQQAAGEHVELLGYGDRTLRGRNVAWILTRMELRMEEYPRYDDLIMVETWPGECRNSVFPRFFCFKDGNGREIGNASSLWILIDTLSREILPSKRAQVEVDAFDDGEIRLPAPKRLRVNPDGRISCFTKLPDYSDIDLNGHVNNTKYVDWFCDYIPVEWYRDNLLKRITVNYLKEVKPGCKLDLELREAENLLQFYDTSEKQHFIIEGEVLKKGVFSA